MGDDEQLGVLPQLLVDLQQPAEVGVVERGLDLVEDVERARARLEERHQEGHRHQRALSAGEQREPLDLLARGPGLDLDAGGEHVRGVGEHQPALPAGEEPRERRVEGLLDVGVGLAEDLLDPVVHVLDDLEEVLAGAAQVVELLGEELVTLLQRRELLQRQRVDLAQHRQRPLGGLEPLDLLLADEGDRLGGLLLDVGALGVARGALLALHRHQLVGAVVGDEGVGLEPQLLEGAVLELLEAHPLLGAGHLVAVHRGDQLLVLLGELAELSAHRAQLLLAPPAGLLHLGAGVGGLLDRRLQAVQDEADGRRDRLGRPALAQHPLPARGGLGALLALLGRAAPQAVGATVQGPGALLGGAQRQARVHLGLPGLPGALRELLAYAGVRLLLGGVLGRGQPLLELREPRDRLHPGLLGPGDRLLEPLGLAPGGAGLGSVLAQLLGDGGQGRVGLVQAGQGDVHALGGLVTLGLEPAGLERGALAGRHGLGEGGIGLLDGCLDLQQALLLAGAAGGVPGAEDVPGRGHRGDQQRTRRGPERNERRRRRLRSTVGCPVEPAASRRWRPRAERWLPRSGGRRRRGCGPIGSRQSARPSGRGQRPDPRRRRPYDVRRHSARRARAQPPPRRAGVRPPGGRSAGH